MVFLWTLAVGGAMVVAGALLLRRFLSSGSAKTVRDGVVLLHQFPRTRRVPNASPPCLKLETYLRVAGIPYECDFRYKTSSKGKTPWIEYNGKAIADSNFCVKFLNAELKVDLDQHLTQEQRAIARAFLVMVEENTYWTLVHHRWIENPSMMKKMLSKVAPWPLTSVALWFLQRKTTEYMHGHGIGRHSANEIKGISEEDLQAVSGFLGEKNFFMGEKVSLVDCAVFSIVSIFLFQDTESHQHRYIKENLPNLVRYVETMKQEFYPDWDKMLGSL